MSAGTRGCDNIAFRPFKYPNGVLGDRACFSAQTCIEIRLSTAGLIGREIYIQPEAVENVYDSLTRLRVEGIDEAGDKKLDGGHESILPLVS